MGIDEMKKIALFLWIMIMAVAAQAQDANIVGHVVD